MDQQGDQNIEMSQQKIFNDPIHGHIEMHPLFVEIIDTPQFQRLRNIKQLGGGYFVYPGASHNRFEHSIGVCHLAGKLIKILQERQRESKTDENKKITEKDDEDKNITEKDDEDKNITDKDDEDKNSTEKDEELTKTLQEHQRESKTDDEDKKITEKDKTKPEITEKDVLCVQIAGLCHDLGHGPFSHVFEDFMKEAGKKFCKEWMSKWKHEDQSVKMFEALLQEETKETTERRTIEKLMRDVYHFTDDDFKFIKALIKGKKSPDSYTTNRHIEALVKIYEALIQTIDTQDLWKDKDQEIKLKDLEEIKQLIRKSNTHAEDNSMNQGVESNESTPTTPEAGTRSNKPFLYEIVANKRTGIDVDKMDYLIRDCHHLGMKCNFDHERYMMFARVCKNQICMRDKEARNMYELFHARHSLHSSAYQHPVKKLVERMIVEALLEAEKGGFQIPGIGKKITDAVEDAKSYLHLTDDVLQDIMRSTSEHAKNLIERIQIRKLYELIDMQTFPYFKEEERKLLKENIPGFIKALERADVTEEDLDVLSFSLDYGKKEEDPIHSLRFYTKQDPNKRIRLTAEQVSYLLPKRFTETKVMLYNKGKTKLNLDKETTRAALEDFWDI